MSEGVDVIGRISLKVPTIVVRNIISDELIGHFTVTEIIGMTVNGKLCNPSPVMPVKSSINFDDPFH